MAIKAECPVCHRKQAVSNKLCECGQVEGYQPRPFGCEVGSQFHHRPRFPRPPGLLTTQVAPTAALTSRLGSRDFYIRASHGSLPYCAPDMLVV